MARWWVALESAPNGWRRWPPWQKNSILFSPFRTRCGLWGLWVCPRISHRTTDLSPSFTHWCLGGCWRCVFFLGGWSVGQQKYCVLTLEGDWKQDSWEWVCLLVVMVMCYDKMMMRMRTSTTVVCPCVAIHRWHHNGYIPDATANAGTSSESCQHFQMFKDILVTSKVLHKQWPSETMCRTIPNYRIPCTWVAVGTRGPVMASLISFLGPRRKGWAVEGLMIGSDEYRNIRLEMNWM